MQKERRRLRAPWSFREVSEEAFAIETADGTRVSFVYHADPVRLGTAFGDRLTKDEAEKIARAIARIPELLSAERAVKAAANKVEI